MSYVIAYNRPWCRNLSERLEKKTGKNFVAIDNKKDLNRDHLNSINPKHIFFPHWSYIIPEEIFENFNCIILNTNIFIHLNFIVTTTGKYNI